MWHDKSTNCKSLYSVQIWENMDKIKLQIQTIMLIHLEDMMDSIWDALHDLVPFLQFKKREKHPLMSVTFSKFAG